LSRSPPYPRTAPRLPFPWPWTSFEVRPKSTVPTVHLSTQKKNNNNDNRRKDEKNHKKKERREEE
jgi:hypothetical protein